jgi:hypothetical protein
MVFKGAMKHLLFGQQGQEQVTLWDTATVASLVSRSKWTVAVFEQVMYSNTRAVQSRAL